MDEIYMDIAINLAKKGVGQVNPNPLVGAVIVKNNKVIGLGYHEKYGEAHAERNAVKSAKEDIEGSTIYVTLEPCAHYGKTPPCVDLLIEKKFKRVVIGMMDPNPLVAGKSIQKLRESGIEVTVGVREKECKDMNEIFIKYITTKKPFVLLKSGISLDGKIATSMNESKWITCEESRIDSNRLRGKYKGILVGVNTVIEDNPSLTCRYKAEEINIYDELKKKNISYSSSIDFENKSILTRNPIRIVLDSNLRIPLDSIIINEDAKDTIIATTVNCDKNKKELLESRGVQVIVTNSKNNRVDLKDLIKRLSEINIDSILIEGGGNVNFSALEEKIVDKVRFYISPKIIGGDRSKSSIGGKGFEKLKDAVKLKSIEYENINEDLVVNGYIQ